MITLQKTVTIPADHRLHCDWLIPEDIPEGTVEVRLVFPAFGDDREIAGAKPLDPRLKGAVNPAIYGKGKICGDIIGPFHEEWENALDEGEGIW